MIIDENDLCEICIANTPPPKHDGSATFNIDVYWINTHCIELRRNREARENKNVKPLTTVF